MSWLRPPTPYKGACPPPTRGRARQRVEHGAHAILHCRAGGGHVGQRGARQGCGRAPAPGEPGAGQHGARWAACARHDAPQLPGSLFHAARAGRCALAHAVHPGFKVSGRLAGCPWSASCCTGWRRLGSSSRATQRCGSSPQPGPAAQDLGFRVQASGPAAQQTCGIKPCCTSSPAQQASHAAGLPCLLLNIESWKGSGSGVPCRCRLSRRA